MNLVQFLLQQSRKTMVLSTVAGALSGMASAAMLGLINSMLAQAERSVTPRQILLFVGLCFVVPLTRVLSSYLLVRVGQTAVQELRLKLSRQVLSLPLRRLERAGAHRLLVTLTEDLYKMMRAVTSIPTLSVNCFIILGCLAYLGWLLWPALLAFLTFMALGVVAYRWPLNHGNVLFRRAREERDTLYKTLRALIDGNKELKLHRHRRQAFIGELDKVNVTLKKLALSAEFIFILAATVGELLILIAIGLLLIGLPMFMEVDQKTLVGYTLIIFYVVTPIQVIMNTLPTFSRANVAARKVEDLGLTLSEALPEAGSATPEDGVSQKWRSLSLRGVKYGYAGETEDYGFSLGPIDLDISAGEVVFIIGGNGSGKTTLLKLLIGLYTPDEGEIRFNGELITDENRAHFRENFSVVFSDYFLFESLLGLEDTQLDENARSYLAKLELERKVKIEGGHLSTLDLSQGQRKRLALLTAFLEDRDVYVFDEWAADQDPHFKQVFYYSILPELKARGKTVVAITHDDNYFDVADRIIKMGYAQIEYDRESDEQDERMALSRS